MHLKLKKIMLVFLSLIMAVGMLPFSAYAASNTGHSISVTFKILYVDDKFNVGYDYGAGENTTFVCQYTTSHSDDAYNNHSMAISDIKAAADRLSASLNENYQIVGWTKKESADPKVNSLTASGTTACNKGTPIFLVAKKTTSNIVLSYDGNHESVTNVPTSEAKTVKAGGSASFTISSKAPVCGCGELHAFDGWNTKADGSGIQYKADETLTASKSTTLYATWSNHKHVDQDGDGYCDVDQQCLHVHEGGFCTKEDCAHPHEGEDACCPLEEKLTEVTLKSSAYQGKLFYLKDTFTVTTTANTAADIQLAITDKDGNEIPAFKLINTEVSEDGKTTVFTYETAKIFAAYTKLYLKATAVKGSQNPVYGTMDFGVNMRNRAHVTVKYQDGTIVKDAAIKLMHKYPQWNPCPSLKYNEKNQEYVMANAWDLSNQPFEKISIKVGDDTYEVLKDKDGEDLLTAFSNAEKEIYVEFVVGTPIRVKVYVNDALKLDEEYKGNVGEKLDLGAIQKSIVNEIFSDSNKMITGMTVEGLNNGQAVFGECTEVTMRITTQG